MVTNAQWRELCFAVTELLESLFSLLSPIFSLVGINVQLTEVCTFFFGSA